MEFNRDSMIALYLAGKPQVAIANKSFVSHTIARYHGTGSIALRPKSVRKKNVNNTRND